MYVGQGNADDRGDNRNNPPDDVQDVDGFRRAYLLLFGGVSANARLIAHRNLLGFRRDWPLLPRRRLKFSRYTSTLQMRCPDINHTLHEKSGCAVTTATWPGFHTP